MSVTIPLLSLLPLLNPVKAIYDGVTGAFEWLITNITNALFEVLNYFVAGEITQNLLLLDSGSHNLASASTYPSLATTYRSLTGIYFATLAVSIISVALTRMFFPNNPQTSLPRLGERYLAATLVVGAFGPLIWNGIFEVNYLVGNIIWESGGGAGFEFRLQDEMFNTTSSLAAIVGLAVILLYLGSSIVLTILGFWAILGIRLVILAAGYALTPVLLALWAPDVGIGQYASLTARAFYGLVAVLLFLGLLIAAILSTGGALINQQGTVSEEVIQTAAQSPSPDQSQARVTGEFQTATHVSDSPLNFLFPIFVWAGSIWTCIIATIGLLGGAVSSGVDFNQGSAPSDEGDENANQNEDSDQDEDPSQDSNTDEQNTDTSDTESDTDSNTDTQTRSHSDPESDEDNTLTGKAIVAGGRARQFAGRRLESVPATRVENLGKQVQNTSLTETSREQADGIKEQASQRHSTLAGEDQDKGDKTAFQDGYSKASKVGKIAARGVAVYGHTVRHGSGTEGLRYIFNKGRESDILAENENTSQSDTETDEKSSGELSSSGGNTQETMDSQDDSQPQVDTQSQHTEDHTEQPPTSSSMGNSTGEPGPQGDSQPTSPASSGSEEATHQTGRSSQEKSQRATESTPSQGTDTTTESRESQQGNYEATDQDTSTDSIARDTQATGQDTLEKPGGRGRQTETQATPEQPTSKDTEESPAVSDGSTSGRSESGAAAEAEAVAGRDPPHSNTSSQSSQERRRQSRSNAEAEAVAGAERDQPDGERLNSVSQNQNSHSNSELHSIERVEETDSNTHVDGDTISDAEPTEDSGQ